MKSVNWVLLCCCVLLLEMACRSSTDRDHVQTETFLLSPVAEIQPPKPEPPAEQSVGALQQSSQLMVEALTQNQDLSKFYAQLNSNSSKDKEAILKYLLEEYPLCMDGNEDKQRHLRWFQVKDSTQLGLLRERTRWEEGEYGPQSRYELKVKDLRYFGLVGYDVVRFVWWNPTYENFRDPINMYPTSVIGAFQAEMPSSPRVGVPTSGRLALFSHFKLSFDRSPENLDRLFGVYKVAFYLMVDRKYFHQIGFYDTVDRLLMAKPFHQKGLEKEWMEEAMKHKQPWELNSPRSEVVDFANDNHWYYTFWNRRQAEGNDAKVLEILREVREHYR